MALRENTESLKESTCPYSSMGCGYKNSKSKIISHFSKKELQHAIMLVEYINKKNAEHNENFSKNQLEIYFLNDSLRMKEGNIIRGIEELKEDLRRKEILINGLQQEIVTIQNNERSQRESLYSAINDLMGEVNILKKDVEDSRKVNEDLKIEINDLKKEVDDLKKVNDDLKTETNDMKKKFEDQRIQINDTKLKNNDLKKEYDDLKKNFDDLLEKSSQNEQIFEDRERSINSLTNEDIIGKPNLFPSHNDVTELKLRIKDINKELKDIKYSKIKMDSQIFDEKKFIWRVDKFSKMREDRRERRIILWRYSLKLCLSLWCFGDNLKFQCRIMKGEFDDDLNWPMKHKITFSLINQSTMSTYKSEEFQCELFEGDKSAFDKPKEKWNNFIGDVKFTTVTDIIESRGLLLKDSLLLCLNIDYN